MIHEFKRNLYLRLLPPTLFSICILSAGIFGQLPRMYAKTASDKPADANGSEAKIRQLESRIESMQKQIEELKLLVVNAIASKNDALPTAEVLTKTVAEKPLGFEPRVNRELDAVQKNDLGVDIGHARLTPYGSIYFNAFGNSGGTNNADVPLFATPTGRSGTTASMRQSRFGVRVEGGKVGSARLNAVLEADFYGGFPSVGIGENFGVVRLRLANVRLDWERTSVTLGQDWSIFAPLSPTSLAAAAIPQMAAAGNNWARLPQVKVETRLGKHIRWQGAVAAPQTGDSATNAAFFLQPNSGSASNVLFFESRITFSDTNFLGTKKPVHLAVSGHYGRSRVLAAGTSESREIDSAGLALDWNLPLHDRISLTGEAFFGQNLAGFQGGIFQGYNADFAFRQGMTIIPGGVRAIKTHGGWAQIGITPPLKSDRLSIYGSFGIDDPRNEDLITFVPREFRSRNLAFAINSIYKFTPQLSIGAEFRRFYTDWTLSGRQISSHLNLGAVYSF